MDLKLHLHTQEEEKALSLAFPTMRILPKPWTFHPPAVPISVRRHQD